MHTVDDALQLLLKDVARLPSEKLLADAALMRVLAVDAVARANMPDWDVSTMDGYAVKRSDFHASANMPVQLQLVGEAAAGSERSSLASQTCMRIFTGAPVPEDADVVVPQENVGRVERDGSVWIQFGNAPSASSYIRKQGDDLRLGDVGLSAGTRLRGEQLALLAMMDFAELEVVRRPRVCILPSGNEIRRAGQPGTPAQVADANSPMLRALCQRLGAEAEVLPVVRDDLEALTAAMAGALVHTDLLITSGGVSVGDHDLIPAALVAAGAEIGFHKVAMKPGKPLLFGRKTAPNGRRAYVLGLPGNPASAYVTFAIFGAPLVRTLLGLPPLAESRTATLAQTVVHAPGRKEYLRAKLQGNIVTPLTNQASGAAVSLAHANALLVVPANAERLEQGTTQEVYSMTDLFE
jgi:molybdopterin molybdotransferase